MKKASLEDLVTQGILPDDKKFIDLLYSSGGPTRCSCVCYPLQQKIPYAFPSALSIVGHAAVHLEEGGYPFLQSITTPETMPTVMQGLFEYMQYSKHPGFDPRSILIQDFPFDVVRYDGTICSVVSTALGLTYASNADLEYAICFVTGTSQEVLNENRLLLTELKKRHNEIHKHPAFINQHESLKRINLLGEEPQNITHREKEVLKLLANGLTSQEIANHLSIEENTVESHRKNILAKFDAKNIAELIKKASKVYWLE